MHYALRRRVVASMRKSPTIVTGTSCGMSDSSEHYLSGWSHGRDWKRGTFAVNYVKEERRCCRSTCCLLLMCRQFVSIAPHKGRGHLKPFIGRGLVPPHTTF
jgi:hypothetical protein